MVLLNGMIRMDEKDYATPSAACSSLVQAVNPKSSTRFDGWKFWSFNKENKRVELNDLRGKESPLTATEKKPNTKKEKAA